MKRLRLSSRRAVVAGALALSLFIPGAAYAEKECISETVTTTYYIFGVEVWSSSRTTTVCVEWVAR